MGEDYSGAHRAPGSVTDRLSNNLAALDVVLSLRDEDRPATREEQHVLAGWTSWGALPQVFEQTPSGRFQEPAARLREALSDTEWAAARRTTINAHYTNPDVVVAVWGVLRQLGFEDGDVLEPGCGSGLFIGSAPAAARMHGVELDPITAEVASRLYPSAQVRAESFAESAWKNETFDAVVGNVPFGKVCLYDPEHNRGHHSIHNHFLLKSLDLTRPGGVVAVLTSRYTMDAADARAREEIFAQADLMAAVRLPTDTHQQMAGTSAITDVLVLRKRMPGEQPGDQTWVDTSLVQVPVADSVAEVEDDTDEVVLNNWWASHPQAVLGRMELGHGMYTSRSLNVTASDTLATIGGHAWNALSLQVSDAQEAGRGLSDPPEEWVRPDPREISAPVARVGDVRQFEGHLEYDAERKEWTRLVGGLPEPIEVPRSQHREVLALVGLRDAVLAVLDAEAADSDDTDELAGLRAQLNEKYDAYLDRYGPVTRYSVSVSSRRDSHGNPIVSHRYQAAQKTFRTDPHSSVVWALEAYHEETGTATKQAIFSKRVVQPRRPATSADSPEDALSITLDQRGRVDLDHVAELLGTDRAQARARLGTLVFADPARDGQLVPAAEYLSGNVRQALTAAQDAAAEDPSWQVNVDALAAVQPRDLVPEEIAVRLGAIWLPASDMQDFLRETLDDRTVKVKHFGGSNWKVEGGNPASIEATSTWGTDRMNALRIAERLMQQKKLLVTDEGSEGKRVTNHVATEAVQAKGDELQERINQWAWEDPDRATRLARSYNDTFNAIRLRSYRDEGKALSLPGLAAGITPHSHQRSAVARMIGEPSVGLFHATGAGKTGEMAMGATELRRLGMIRKPLLVVPNHMLEQFSREWLQWYPSANVLAAGSSDLKGEKRRDFVAKAATGEWDAIIMTQTAFAKIPVTSATRQQYIDEQMASLHDQLEAAKTQSQTSSTIKRMERMVQNREERLKAKLDKTVDPGLSFEQMGVDYLIVDEMHMYKNLTIVSNIDGVNSAGSDRATDLDMKIRYLRSQAGQNGRVVTGATATPIANTMAEAYVMQQYLRPDLLAEAGITDFDAWAATFGQTVSKIEMKPAGNGFDQKTRFARFQNVPELLRMWHVAADVMTTEDLGLPIPDLAVNSEGERVPEIVAIPKSGRQTEFMASLKDRAESLSGPPREGADNILVISTDGRKAGLDLRLLDPEKQPTLDPGGASALTKVQVAAVRIHRIWSEHRTDEFTLPGTNEPHPVRGAFQIVFCDMGTPSSEGDWNMYDGLRDELAEQGMDPARVRFVHEADTDTKKDRLFADCREGRVDVLIGSTQKMGVGTNVQTRAIALHHLDCPWRPADVEQREGRILRQGNQHPEAQILRYVTEGSFDGFMWQTVARKAEFIAQVMHGKLDQRVADDIGNPSEQFGYAVIAAVGAGNPLLLEKAEADEDVKKLSRLQAAHQRDQTHKRNVVTQYGAANERLRALIPRIEEAIDQRTSTSGESFRATVDHRAFTSRPEAADALKATLRPAVEKVNLDTLRSTTVSDVAELGGHQFDALVQASLKGSPSVSLRMHGLQDNVRFSIPGDEIQAEGGHGLITRLENLVSGLDNTLHATQERITHNERQITQANDGLGDPFPRTEELANARARLADVEHRMLEQDKDEQPGEQQTADTADESIAPQASPEQTREPPLDRADQGIRDARDSLRGSQDRIDRLHRRLDRIQDDSHQHHAREREQRPDGPEQQGPSIT